jgi:hypothetical protein
MLQKRQRSKALILLTLTLALSVSCGPLLYLGGREPAAPTYVYQRTPIDCGVAALSMLLVTPYEKILEAVPPGLLEKQGGLTDLDMRSMALLNGHDLRITRWFDAAPPPSKFVGILHIRDLADNHHYVLLRHGMVYDPSPGTVLMPYISFWASRQHNIITTLEAIPPHTPLDHTPHAHIP